jgi:hypothetical protein
LAVSEIEHQTFLLVDVGVEFHPIHEPAAAETRTLGECPLRAASTLIDLSDLRVWCSTQFVSRRSVERRTCSRLTGRCI